VRNISLPPSLPHALCLLVDSPVSKSVEPSDRRAVRSNADRRLRRRAARFVRLAVRSAVSASRVTAAAALISFLVRAERSEPRPGALPLHADGARTPTDELG
jgi:hypothetical protein